MIHIQFGELRVGDRFQFGHLSRLDAYDLWTKTNGQSYEFRGGRVRMTGDELADFPVTLLETLSDTGQDPEKAQMLGIIERMVDQYCYLNGVLDSQCLDDNAEAMRFLARQGRIEIESSNGRRVIGKWIRQGNE